MELKEEVGFVESCQEYLISLEGLPTAKINDIIVSDGGQRAIVSSIIEKSIQALMLDNYQPKPGELFHSSDRGIRIPLGDYLFGRVLNPLGSPIDGKGYLPLDGPVLERDVTAAGIQARKPITEQLETGFALIDTLLPIGKGQKELLFGEARSGKSRFVLDLILHLKGKNVVCIYTAIGKPEVSTKIFSNAIELAGASDYTIVIAATSTQSAPLVAIAPDTALFIAEFFAHKGSDVLLILDDLGVHAKYVREIALFSGEIPGRESYPGGIFFEHSRLMERAGRFNETLGNSSITLIPIIETELENLTNLIPTNIMSQTDGHLLFSAKAHSQGQYPAVDWNRSVTRVGKQTQGHLVRGMATKLQSLLAEYQELEFYSKFESELTETTQKTIHRAQVAIEVFRQDSSESLDMDTQLILLSLVFLPLLDNHELDYFKRNRQTIVRTINEVGEIKKTIKEAKSHNVVDIDKFIELISKKVMIIEDKCQ